MSLNYFYFENEKKAILKRNLINCDQSYCFKIILVFRIDHRFDYEPKQGLLYCSYLNGESQKPEQYLFSAKKFLTLEGSAPLMGINKLEIILYVK